MNNKLQYIYEMYPEAKCELKYNSLFSLLVAVILSAQTTDIKVNKVTPNLFSKYPNIADLANANLVDIEEILKPLGMNKVKATHISKLAKCLQDEYDGKIPKTFDELVKLPGVGTKTANVYLIEGLKIPAFPVDTHVNRIAKRLQLAEIGDSVEAVEIKLKKIIPETLWGQMHHSLIFFGRYFCMAKKPRCTECRLNNQCIKKFK